MIAAKVDAADQEYFETEIRHLLDDPLVDFIGEIGDGKKEAFLGGAAALLMPIGWPEPFGLVVIEAMACGTPVIAFPFGSMPELIEPGVNGALAGSVDQAVEAVEGLAAFDRRLCRRSFEERFTTARMAKNYVRVYEALVEEAVWSQGRAALPAEGIQIAVPALVAGGAAASRLVRPTRRQRVIDRDESGSAPIHGRLLRGRTPSTLQASTEACAMKVGQCSGICNTVAAREAPMPCGSLCRHTSESRLAGPLLSIFASFPPSARTGGSG